jgi:hypothetical protein
MHFQNPAHAGLPAVPWIYRGAYIRPPEKPDEGTILPRRGAQVGYGSKKRLYCFPKGK